MFLPYCMNWRPGELCSGGRFRSARHALTLRSSAALILHDPRRAQHRTPLAAADIRCGWATQNYYNDNHRSPLVIKQRDEYIPVRRELELRQPLWIQLTAEQRKAMSEDSLSDSDSDRHKLGRAPRRH